MRPAVFSYEQKVGDDECCVSNVAVSLPSPHDRDDNHEEDEAITPMLVLAPAQSMKTMT